MLFHTRIQAHEIGIRFRNGDFKQVLQPGLHWRPPNTEDEVYDRLHRKFEHDLLETLLEHSDLCEELEIVMLTDTERALVWQDGRLKSFLGPGRHAFWQQKRALDIEVFDIVSFQFEHSKLDQVLDHSSAQGYLQAIRTDPDKQVMIYRNGQFVTLFGPGLFAYWTGTGKVSYKSFDQREQVLDVSGQEIMTADKVTLRVNLLVSYQIHDPVKSMSVVDNPQMATYREAQLALRAAVGVRSLDELLTDKDRVADEVLAAIAVRTEAFGVAVRSAGLRDVILPGTMKTILNQVIEASKQAEANLIRRREETAAARSQANTARLMAENPVLLRMKELEQLQLVLAGTKATFVLGPGDIAQQIQQMVGGGES